MSTRGRARSYVIPRSTQFLPASRLSATLGYRATGQPAGRWSSRARKSDRAAGRWRRAGGPLAGLAGVWPGARLLDRWVNGIIISRQGAEPTKGLNLWR